MDFQVSEAVELIKVLAETENLTLKDAFRTFVAEAGLDVEYAAQLKGALFEKVTLEEMAQDSLTRALHNVFVVGASAEESLEESETKETQEGTKYKVRVKDRASGSSYIRYATREKIAELRANPNISSVEMTDHGTTGEDDRGERTAAAKAGRDFDGDGKRESSSKEHAGVVHNAIQKRMGGTPDGKDTRKEEVEIEEGIDAKGARRMDAAKGKKEETQDERHKRLMLGKYSPAVKYGKKTQKEATSYEAYLEARSEAKKKVSEGLDMWKPDGDAGTHDQDKKLRGKEDAAKAKKKKSSYLPDLETVKALKKRNKVDEGYKGKHGQSDEEYADSRSQGGKMVSGDSKRSGAEYTHGRRVKAENPGMQPDVGGKTKPKSQGKMDKGSREDLKYRKANLKKEEYILEADLMDAGRENSSERETVKNGKKVDGKGVDNSTRVKLMPYMRESAVVTGKETVAERRLTGTEINADVRSLIKELGDALREETCPKCGSGECGCTPDEEKPNKETKTPLDEAGMPIFETKAESRNNARPGPSKEMIDPPADPQGPQGHMNPKGEPKRYKEPGEAPGDRRPNRKKDKSLPNEDGTVPNGAGV